MCAHARTRTRRGYKWQFCCNELHKSVHKILSDSCLALETFQLQQNSFSSPVYACILLGGCMCVLTLHDQLNTAAIQTHSMTSITIHPNLTSVCKEIFCWLYSRISCPPAR
eukprot:scpid111107/ scgid8240/ 